MTGEKDIFAKDSCEADGNVLDFQHYQLKNLNQRFDRLVDYCRENLSVQAQVHKAALKLMQVRSLEQLLEVISLDMLAIFDVDVVRLAMETAVEIDLESDIPVDADYDEPHYSGMVFIDSGVADVIFGAQKNVLLIGDVGAETPFGFEQIFANCEDLIVSCALMRLELEMLDKSIIFALGVRHKDRFHAHQATEALRFLAQVVSLQMGKYLDDLAL